MTWRAPLYFLLGLFLGGYAAWANAGYALVSPPSGMGFVPGVGYSWKPPVSTPPANGSWTAPGFMKYGGKNIPVPASWGAAANAGTFAKNALRFNPALFVGTTVAAIAIDAGLEYLSDEWKVVEPFVYDTAVPGVGLLDLPAWNYDYMGSCNGGGAPPGTFWREGSTIVWGKVSAIPSGWGWMNNCGGVHIVRLSGLTPSPGVGTIRPAVDDDWLFPVGPLTDTQLDELSRLSPGGLPVTNPALEPLTEVIGQPYTDPVTGQQWRDMLRITPDPTPSSPLRVRVDPYREPLTTPEPTPENPNPSPVPDPNTPGESLPEPLPIFCDWAEVICDLAEWFKEPFVVPEPYEVPELDIDAPALDSFGLPTTAGCPAPRVVSIGFGTFSLSYDPFCQLADMIRPLVLITAYLFAAFILLGVRR